MTDDPQITDPRFDGPGPDATWHAGLARGIVAIQRCGGCGAHQAPPSLLCRACGAPAPGFVDASGKATVYSATTIRRRDGAYNVSIVELAEGPRLMSRVEGDPEAVRIGMALTARIVEEDGIPVLVFDPAPAGGAA
ncbi:OB-fold domain-containing protein [Paralimibaculum aggregatum]|uniref:OB-fold domain-containing protein n=1 Tax=Paralimibaculum aggregatum TaxID=3036245 RepID=A0ABQ6LPG9_9RHOB|nr:OB-fold domain-containing protein [Limibaculum sp. NKW23]GMG84942.1 OB-fold domain-containing protein [Limibaculum sp. NKW23]